jgi:hypothetical protein
MAVSKRASKSRLVSDALLGDCWIRDISGSLSVLTLQQYVSLWVRIQQVQLHPNSPGTDLSGNGPVASSILRRLPIKLSSMGSVLCRLPKNCARQEPR